MIARQVRVGREELLQFGNRQPSRQQIAPADGVLHGLLQAAAAALQHLLFGQFRLDGGNRLVFLRLLLFPLGGFGQQGGGILGAQIAGDIEGPAGEAVHLAVQRPLADGQGFSGQSLLLLFQRRQHAGIAARCQGVNLPLHPQRVRDITATHQLGFGARQFQPALQQFGVIGAPPLQAGAVRQLRQSAVKLHQRRARLLTGPEFFGLGDLLLFDTAGPLAQAGYFLFEGIVLRSSGQRRFGLGKFGGQCHRCRWCPRGRLGSRLQERAAGQQQGGQ